MPITPLYVPGIRFDRFEQALQSGADTIIIDLEDSVSESNENNNRVPITITAVKEVNTVPSFALSMLGITMSGLLAALGMSLRRKEEE